MAMFGIGPSNMGGMMDSIRRKMGGNTGITGGMFNQSPEMQRYRENIRNRQPMPMPGASPMPIDRGLSTGPVRPPRMPQIQPNPAQMAPISPSGGVINRFLPPQPGGSDFPTINLGGRQRWRMY